MWISIHFNPILNDRQPKCCFSCGVCYRCALHHKNITWTFSISVRHIMTHRGYTHYTRRVLTCNSIPLNTREWQVIKLKPEIDAIGEILDRQTTELTSFSFMLAPGINVTHGRASSSRQDGTAALSYCLSPSPHPFLAFDHPLITAEADCQLNLSFCHCTMNIWRLGESRSCHKIPLSLSLCDHI